MLKWGILFFEERNWENGTTNTPPDCVRMAWDHINTLELKTVVPVSIMLFCELIQLDLYNSVVLETISRALDK